MTDRAHRGNLVHTMLPVRLAAAALLALVVLGVWIPTAGSQSEEPEARAVEPGMVLTAVDATGSTVELSLIGLDPATNADSLALTVDGEPVDVADVVGAAEAGRPVELAIIVDTNVRAAAGDVLEVIKANLVAEVSALPETTSIAVISAGDSALVATGFTTDRAKQISAIEDLSARNGSALFNAVDRASRLFGDDPDAVQSLLIISTGIDTRSEVTVAEARVGLVQSGIQLISVGYQGGGAELLETVSRTAGKAFTAATIDGIDPALSMAFAASDRAIVSFAEPQEAGARSGVVLELGDQRAAFSYPSGVRTSNTLQLAALTEESEPRFAFFNSSTGLYIALGLAFVGISLGVWSLGSIVAGGDVRLEGMLARYTHGAPAEEDGEPEELVVQSALLQRAVDFSESFAEKRGFLARVEDMLEQASLPIRAGEGMFILAAITILSGSFGLVLSGSVLAAGLLAVFATGLAFFVVRMMGRRRFTRFEAQLPDTLQLLSGTLRAGYSLPQGLEAVSHEIADPMGEELRRAMTEVRLGRDLEDSLSGVAERLSSADFSWTVMAISIQREVGGNLNELLMSVSDTMVARERLKREVAALTAEGRVSAAVLSFLPPGLGLVMWVMNPGYIALLFSETMGNILLGLGVVSALVGLAWMKKVITVDV